MNLNEYYTLLNHHDWFYEYSDDHSVWERGNRARRELMLIAKQTPQHQTLFDSFYSHMMNKEGEMPIEPIVIPTE